MLQLSKTFAADVCHIHLRKADNDEWTCPDARPHLLRWRFLRQLPCLLLLRPSGIRCLFSIKRCLRSRVCLVLGRFFKGQGILLSGLKSCGRVDLRDCCGGLCRLADVDIGRDRVVWSTVPRSCVQTKAPAPSKEYFRLSSPWHPDRGSAWARKRT